MALRLTRKKRVSACPMQIVGIVNKNIYLMLKFFVERGRVLGGGKRYFLKKIGFLPPNKQKTNRLIEMREQ